MNLAIAQAGQPSPPGWPAAGPRCSRCFALAEINRQRTPRSRVRSTVSTSPMRTLPKAGVLADRDFGLAGAPRPRTVVNTSDASPGQSLLFFGSVDLVMFYQPILC